MNRLLIFVMLSLFLLNFNTPSIAPRVLVFTKTAGYRHSSIPVAVAAIQKLGKQNGFVVDTTGDAVAFAEHNLKKYAAVIFVSTTGDILDHVQQADFERYIQAGGGFVGVHGVADSEYDWPWFGRLIGGYFDGHPAQQEADLHVIDRSHVSSRHLPAVWRRKDEWYNFRQLDSTIRILINIDEQSYQGGTNGSAHPMAWYHPFDGGRAFYTALGHTEESYSEQNFLKHLLGGIRYAIGKNAPLNYNRAKTPRVPRESSFKKVVLSQGQFTEPTEMAVLPNGNVLVAQRRGEVMLYNETTKKLSEALKLNVYHTALDTNVNAEEGLLGIAADPAFRQNNFVYLYYSAADTPVNRLSRFKMINNKLDSRSEKVILEVYSQREICCHTGGSVAFDKKGLLYLSTGDNTTPFNEKGQTYQTKGFGPMDDRPGHEQYDGRRTSGNTNDLRGKILRIRVNADGTYSIPEGNLFPEGTDSTRAEIYIMGTRNPYRISVDARTGYLYWGEVGPDAQQDDPLRGPRGFDEINQARKAGNFGYPFFIGKNYAYRAFDYNTGTNGEAFNVMAPSNISRNNTGLTVLPPAQPAMIWYPYGPSTLFPQVGSGARTAMAGPVYNAASYLRLKGSLPLYYDRKLFIYDWVRGWVKAVTLDSSGNYVSMEPFMSGTAFNAPVDMELGHDGKLYVLEYGKGWFSKNPDAALSRIDYDPARVAPVEKPLSIGARPAVDSAEMKFGHQQKAVGGETAIKLSDCLTCHKTKEKSIGPSFVSVAKKYPSTEVSKKYLANKIINGGGGVWGEVPMPAHSALTTAEARKMVDFILSLKE